jgi:Tol biopolymer transport system component
MNDDGTNKVRMTNNNTTDLRPNWSPDGTKITFNSQEEDDEIYVINTDGSGLMNLTNNEVNDYAESWSPDGTKIIFTSEVEHKEYIMQEIYITDADGSNRTKITNYPSYERIPFWSPDGSKIGFASWGYHSSFITIGDLDGTNQFQLENLKQYQGIDYVNWSPDGTSIIFTAWITSRSLSNIYLTSLLDGLESINLTGDSEITERNAKWSPDGAKIPFESHRSTMHLPESERYTNLFVMDYDGQNKINLTQGYEAMGGVWSPDGNKIAFIGNNETTNYPNIYVMNADGSDKIRLTEDISFVQDISWQTTFTQIIPQITAVTQPLEELAQPSQYMLSQNFPNPFNPITTIPYLINEPGDVSLSIVNLAGQRVKTIFEGHREPGNYKEQWNGANDSGDLLASGIYLYRLQTENYTETKKMLLIK